MVCMGGDGGEARVTMILKVVVVNDYMVEII